MANNTDPEVKAKIGLITETVGTDSSGRAVTGLRVPFKTAKGQDGYVFIPGTTIDKDAIVQAVRERATALDDLAHTEVK